ncbi:MAG: hypothetical protein QOI89_2488 [Solirubrobacteraceae bacterium]|jgi:hypothetical protein|nr:hypothetical protein [Solirubrobacteraceae bacterium]
MEGRRPKARYASAACRTRDWKRRHGIPAGDALETSQTASQKRPERRSAPRVYLFKAQRVADEVVGALEAASVTPTGVRRIIDTVLIQSLSDRQRQQLVAINPPPTRSDS